MTNRTARSLDSVMLGDCTALMTRLEEESIDFVLTDPPYITRYCDRSGRRVANDDNDLWLAPAFAEIFRLLKSRAARKIVRVPYPAPHLSAVDDHVVIRRMR